MLFGLLSARLAFRYAPSFLGASRRVLTPSLTRGFALSQPRLIPASATASRTGKTKTSTKASTATKKTVKKAVAKKKAKSPAKKPAKKAVRRTRTPTKPRKITVPPGSKPPSRPAGPFILFFRKYYQGADLSNVEDKRAEAVRLTSEAGRVWKSLSDHEKQAFRDEWQTSYDEYVKKRDEYYRNVDPALLKEINRRRVQKGKPRLHKPASLRTRRPLTPFFLFVKEERPHHAQPVGREGVTALSKELGAQWRALSDAEKKRYKDQFQEDLKRWRASQA